jgi:hypothetical protein
MARCKKEKRPLTAVELALKKLASKDEAERAQAETELREMGSGAIGELSDIMKVESERRKKGQHQFFVVIGAYIGIIVLVLISLFAYRAITGNSVDVPEWIFNLFQYSGVLGGAMAVSQTQKSAGKALALLQDPKTVGFLAEALWFGDKKIQEQAKTALIRLLPLVQPSDVEDMTPEQRDCLYKALKDKDAQLVLAILNALRLIGDGHALPHVQRLIDHPEVNGIRNDLVKKTAEETLPYIQEFASKEQAAGTLLRAVSAPMDEDTLLRPAGTGMGTDPDLLLRPTGVEEGQQTINITPLVANYSQNQEPEQLHARNGH